MFAFFAVQLLSNIVVTLSSLGANCASFDATHYIGSNVNYLTLYGVSVIGTNVLCHRYLLEKAKIMTNLYVSTIIKCLLSSPVACLNLIIDVPFLVCSLDDANDPSVEWLKKLESSLKWETRSLVFVLLGVPLVFVNRSALDVALGLGTAVVIVMVRTMQILNRF